MDQLVAFVSYATADGLEFAQSLVGWLEDLDPPIIAWIDRHNPKDTSFEDRIENAIFGSDVLLLVLTPSAIEKRSWARSEVLAARTWDKPIIAVRPHWSKATMPLSASDMTYVDLASTKDWSRLARELRLLQPANMAAAELSDVLRATEDLASRTAGTERDLLRARAGVISALLQQEQRRADDPTGAERQVRRLIADGQRADAGEQVDHVTEGPFRVVDEPSKIAGWALHDRYTEREMLLAHLQAAEVRIVALCGPPGVGKTAIVRDLADLLQQIGYVGVAYASTHDPRRVTPRLLLEKVARAHPDDHTSGLLLEHLADSSYSWHQNMSAVVTQFAGRPVLIVIDNAEELIDAGRLTDPHIREFAHTVAHTPQSTIRLLLVSRTTGPRTNDSDDRTRRVDIPPGLPRPFAIELARALDIDGTAGLRSANGAALEKVYTLTAGNPGQLELFYGVLRGQRNPDPDELLRSIDERRSAGRDNSANYLMRRAVAGLSEPIRHVLQALAVYDRPVRPAAVSWLLAPYYPGFDSTAALDLLRDQRIVHCEGDLYYIPADPTGTVLETIPIGKPSDRTSGKPRFTRHALWHLAANYFRDVRSIGPRVQDLNDLAPYFGEIDLRLAGSEFAEAATLVKEIDGTYLRYWDYRSLVLQYRERLVGRLADNGSAELENRYDLAAIHLEASQPEQAEAVLLQAIDLARLIRPGGDSALQIPLAKAYQNAGRLRAAVATYKDVLRWCRPEARSASRIGLAACLSELGQTEEAFREYSLALKSARTRSEDASARLGIGLIHQDRGQPLDALAAIEEARRLAIEQADVRSIARCDDAAAFVLIDTGQLNRSRRLADSAIKIALDAGNVDLTREAYFTLALGNLLAGRVEEALDAADAAARFFDNKRPLASLALLGITQLRLGKMAAAERSFLLAGREIDQLLKIEPRAVQILDFNALVRTGLTLHDPAPDWEPIRQAYRRARNRTRAPGVVMRAVRLLDELLDGASSPEFSAIRRAALGADRQ